MAEGYELIITEKPRVTQRIAEALADGALKQEKKGKVSYYTITHSGKKIVVAPAVGHVFSLTRADHTPDFPIFNIKWVPIYEASKHAAYTKPYIAVLKQLAKNATSFVNACDFDIEGSLIGANVLRFACGESAFKNARRMKFSTLTEDDLIKAYEKALPHLDFNMVSAGETRHTLDWYWGINTSRALSYAYKALTGRYQTISAGRVQTPTLKILDDREQEIKKFKPEPFWVINALIDAKEDIETTHIKEKFFKKDEAKTIFDKCTGKDAQVSEVSRKKQNHAVPIPFNLGGLQAEVYKLFKYSPKNTQMLAQRLYESGVISYPRTSSQKLPKALDYRKILEKLGSKAAYKETVEKLLSQKALKPKEGAKKDPAHPAVHPTGELPKGISDQEFNVYDLIVKRFFAVFGKPAIREFMKIIFKISDEDFKATGARTLEKNWHELYEPYVRLKEVTLPDLKKDETYKVKKLTKDEKETQPPNRYSQAAIVKKMEDLGIGTKATRANIVQTLYDRNYVEGKQITVTEFGSRIVETITKHAPELTSEQLTRDFEEHVEKLQEGKGDQEKILAGARETLIKISEELKAHQQEIAEALVESHREAVRKTSTLGPCPKCGKDLMIRRSRASGKQFVGCGGYPDCTNSFPLPQSGLIQKTTKTCKECNLPVIKVIRRARRPYEMCINHKCKTKENWGKKKGKKKKEKK